MALESRSFPMVVVNIVRLRLSLGLELEVITPRSTYQRAACQDEIARARPRARRHIPMLKNRYGLDGNMRLESCWMSKLVDLGGSRTD